MLWDWKQSFIICIAFCSLCTRSSSDYDDSEEDHVTTTSEPLPYFDDHLNLTNITAPLGGTVFLQCKVNILKDKIVSWMRREDGEVRLLTFGLHTYSGDERLSINFEQPNNWKLRIRNAQSLDRGNYECQVSTHPPIVLKVTLNVIVPQISIVDDLDRPLTDKFYNAGSTLELRCIITHLPILYNILWKQGNKTLNYDTSRGGISVKTTIRKEGAVSVLYIANARKNDSGPYVCSLGNLTHNTIHVHVINGEGAMAMAAGNGAVESVMKLKQLREWTGKSSIGMGVTVLKVLFCGLISLFVDVQTTLNFPLPTLNYYLLLFLIFIT